MVEGAAEAHEQRTDALEPLAALTELLGVEVVLDPPH